jgi:hypothetical protein
MMNTEPEASDKALAKDKWHITNWPEYDRSLVRRGSLTVWFDDEFVSTHWHPKPTGKRGAQMKYSDLAIQILLVLKQTFHLPYRALEGFAGSLMQLTGLNLAVPDHSNISRRAKKIQIAIPRIKREKIEHVVVDSTGLKIYGEGEWKVRKHGASKRRRWLKVHLAIDANVKDAIGVEVTTEEWADCEMFADLMAQVEGQVEQIDGDGAYDTREAYEVAEELGAKLVVPPRDNAVNWEEGHPRNDVLKQIADEGLAAWKEKSGYHRRSIAENAMYRLKQLFGNQVSSRLFDTQVVEVHARIVAMNIMTYLGMPISVRVGISAT